MKSIKAILLFRLEFPGEPGGESKRFLILNNSSGDGKSEGGRVCGIFYIEKYLYNTASEFVRKLFLSRNPNKNFSVSKHNTAFNYSTTQSMILFST